MKKLFAGFVFLFSLTTFATDLISALGRSDESFNYSQYYQVQERLESANTNLLSLTKIKKQFPLPTQPYNRLKHFGTWIQDSKSCLNTRGEVLRRDSKDNVSYTSGGCSVADGNWHDPYSGQAFTSAADIQIDHLVPLKNAYMTGAFEWGYKKRCLYTNYMGNNFHLLAVQGRENLRKSDNSPDGYIPPNKAYVCQYLKEWLQIKLIWSLRMTPQEVATIQKSALDAKCDTKTFVVSADELKEQRRYMEDNAEICTHH